MTDRTIIERSVVIVSCEGPTGIQEAVAEAFLPWGGHVTVDWKVSNHKQSLEDLQAALDGTGRALVRVDRPRAKNIKDAIHAQEKAVRQIVSTSTKKGYEAYVSDDEWTQFAKMLPMPIRVSAMPLDRREDVGPFDIIGDVHGCALELMDLLVLLGHARHGWEDSASEKWDDYLIAHASGRKTILLGDLVDRGPQNLASMRIAKRLEELGGLRVLGNHDAKVGKWLNGRDVKMGPHQEPTMREFDGMTSEDRATWGSWMLDARAHYILDHGQLVVAHAGMDEENLGRETGGAHSMALYGKPSKCGGLDEDGFPLSEDWALDYQGEAVIVHGHVVHDEPRETNGKVIAVDTGCVFGGNLTAYQWPERSYVAVPARREWCKRRPN